MEHLGLRRLQYLHQQYHSLQHPDHRHRHQALHSMHTSSQHFPDQRRLLEFLQESHNKYHGL